MSWSPKRIACLVAGVVLAGVAVVVPPLAPVVAPLSKLLLAGGAFLGGVATRTPGHVPADQRGLS